MRWRRSRWRTQPVLLSSQWREASSSCALRPSVFLIAIAVAIVSVLMTARAYEAIVWSLAYAIVNAGPTAPTSFISHSQTTRRQATVM